MPLEQRKQYMESKDLYENEELIALREYAIKIRITSRLMPVELIMCFEKRV